MICIDASVAAKLVLAEEYSEHVESLVEATVKSGEAVIAPPLLPLEVTNIIRRRMVRDAIAFGDAEALLARFLALPIQLQAIPNMHWKALAIANALGLPTAYDAYYLAVAIESGCDFWSDDRRLLQSAGSLSFVRWIGDYLY